MLTYISLLALSAIIPHAYAQVTGSATGFAAGTTGGGDATPASPADIDELVSWLTDDTPRVIMIDKTFDFIGSEGTATETGCIPGSNTCGSSGQNALDGPNWCSADNPSVEGNKSVVGVGDVGVIKGKGFRLTGGQGNVIFQNIWFTDLNPQYIWGGDILTLTGTDLVWIDHCKFSLVGRQMIVTGYEQAGRVTISNNEFDGVTDWSASCNGEHYWTMLFLGAADKITLSSNWIHDTSGRSPKVGGSGSITMQAVNNYWSTNGGHAFDVAEGGKILIEGNVFEDVKIPITEDSATEGGYLFNVPDSSAASTCSSYIGRDCVVNSLSGSGDFASYTDTEVFSGLSADVIVDAVSTDGLAAIVEANAGVGKLSGYSSSTSNASIISNSTTAASLATGMSSSSLNLLTGVAHPASSSAAGTGIFSILPVSTPIPVIPANATSSGFRTATGCPTKYPTAASSGGFYNSANATRFYLPTAVPSGGFCASSSFAAPSAVSTGYHRCGGRGRRGWCPDRPWGMKYES